MSAGAAGISVGLGAPRVKRVVNDDQVIGELLGEMLGVADGGLSRMRWPSDGQFSFTRRKDPRGALELTGRSTRYAAIVALGAQHLPLPAQRNVCGTDSALALIGDVIAATERTDDLGDLALTCWAAAELGHSDTTRALDRLLAALALPGSRPTVSMAWALSALIAAREVGSVQDAADQARTDLLAARRPGGAIFAHQTDPNHGPWYRSHVGCFADQVYPVQALARLHAAFGDTDGLAVADDCAERICAIQGTAGQWWWHYDWRTDRLIEGYPVYSVHQHAMAPMALLDLEECGGKAHLDAIRLGVRWMLDRPETTEDLVRGDLGLIWRKVGRREWPPKSIRGLLGVTTRLSPTHRLPVDQAFPPGPVDYECRPYELGWLLYSWLDSRDQSRSRQIIRQARD